MSKDFENRPYQFNPKAQGKPRQEGGNGAPGIPTTLNELAKPPPEKSAISRVVEPIRALYERNRWVFLPLSEAGKPSLSLPNVQGEQQPHSGGINKPEVLPPKEKPLAFEPILTSQEHQTSNPSAADQVILTKFQESSELLSHLPHPLAPEMNEEMWNRAVEEVWRDLDPELKSQAEELDEEVIEALQSLTLQKRILGRD